MILSFDYNTILNLDLNLPVPSPTASMESLTHENKDKGRNNRFIDWCTFLEKIKILHCPLSATSRDYEMPWTSSHLGWNYEKTWNDDQLAIRNQIEKHEMTKDENRLHSVRNSIHSEKVSSLPISPPPISPSLSPFHPSPSLHHIPVTCLIFQLSMLINCNLQIFT